MKEFLVGFILLISSLLVFAIDENLEASISDIDLVDLQAIKVESPSRNSISIRESPSVISVITADEIKRNGYSTLSDVLQFVPGFFISRQQAFPIISNRGLYQDMNSNFLLLIDGHPLNSIVENGMYHEDRFPLLSKVKRIEIIHGPASTMWGTDAASGIINIITKSADDLILLNDSTNTAVEYQYRFATDDVNSLNISNVHSINIANKTKISDLFISGTYYNSQTNWDSVFRPGANKIGVWKNRAHPNLDWEPGGEVFAKLKVKDFMLLGRYASLNDAAGRLSYPSGDTFSTQSKNHIWIEGRYKKLINKLFDLDVSAHYDYMDYWLYNAFKKVEGHYPQSTESGFGAQAILNMNLFKDHYTLLGIEHRHMIVPTQYKPLLSNYSPSWVGGIDNSYAIYAEDSWQVLSEFLLIYGVRLDGNDRRDKSWVLLPRFSSIYMVNDYMTIKYMFNSGYIRPSFKQGLGINNGGPYSRILTQGNISKEYDYYGASNPEKVYSNDLQFLYFTNKTSLQATLYYTKINNYITWIGYENAVNNIYYQDQNITSLETKGAEIELKQRVFSFFDVNSGMSYSHTEAEAITTSNSNYTLNMVDAASFLNEQGEMIGVPRLIWYSQLRFNIKHDFFVNVKYRGWGYSQTRIEYNPNKFKNFGEVNLVDLNLVYEKNKRFMSVFCNNVLNSKPKIPILVNGGFSFFNDRVLGLSIGIVF